MFNVIYNVSVVLEISGVLDIVVLEWLLEEIICCYVILWSCIEIVNGIFY